MNGVNFTQDSIFEKFKNDNNYPFLFVPHILVAGSCWAFIYKDHATLIDLASKDDFTHIRDQLTDKGVKYIDNIFISHYHGDHDCYDSSVPLANCYDKWKQAFDMDNVHMYVPRNAPLDEYDDTKGYDAVQASFSSSQITLIDNNTEVVWNSLTITVRNQSVADWNYYVENQPEYSPGVRDLNALSAIFYIDTEDNTILYTGDITKIAHTYCISQGYFRSSYLVSAPHHGVSDKADPQMPAILHPKIITVSNNYTAGIKWGVQCPFVRDCSFADIYESIFNKEGILIDISSKNFQVVGKTSKIGGIGTTADRRVYYIDETVDADSLQDGSEAHPFKYLRGVITRCTNVTKIILLSDITYPINLSGNNGVVEIDGQGHTIYGINIGNNAYLNLHDVRTAADYGIYGTNSTLIGDNITFATTSPTQQGGFDHCNIYLTNVTLDNARLTYNITNSNLYVTTISGTCPYDYLMNSCSRSTVVIYGNTTGKLPYLELCQVVGSTIDGSTSASKFLGGWTYRSRSQGYIDLPRPYCMINTVRSGPYVVQFAISMTGDTSGSNLPLEMFIRKQNSPSAVWSDWIEIVGLSDSDWVKNIQFIQKVPERPTTAGDYNLQVNVNSSNIKTYKWSSFPNLPTIAGNYVLQCTLVNNVPEYQWVVTP